MVPWVNLQKTMFCSKLVKKFSFVDDLTAVRSLLSGRGFLRGHSFGRAIFPRGRGFHPRRPGHVGRMGFTEHEFGSPYPPFRGRSNAGRGNENNKLCSSSLKMKLINFIPLSSSLTPSPISPINVNWSLGTHFARVPHIMITQLKLSQKYYYTLYLNYNKNIKEKGTSS